MKKRLIKKITNFESRKKYKINRNLRFLLFKRFGWMKKQLKNKKIIIEIGSGNGLSKKILGNKIILTDIFNAKWIDFRLEMNVMKLSSKYKNKVDIFILNHSLHHSDNPYKLFRKLNKFLKVDGKILINDPEISFFFKFFLIICNHERWSFKKNDWKDNNATAHILFNNRRVNQVFLKNYTIEKNVINEFIIFLNSGGNGVASPYIELSPFFLSLVDKLDNLLIRLSPNIFALNRSVILRKKQ